MQRVLADVEQRVEQHVEQRVDQRLHDLLDTAREAERRTLELAERAERIAAEVGRTADLVVRAAGFEDRLAAAVRAEEAAAARLEIAERRLRDLLG